MKLTALIKRNLRHYAKGHLAAAAGIAIATAVICGALIIGDSLRLSLQQIVELRLGRVTHSLSAGEGIFSADVARRLDAAEGIQAAPVLKTIGSVSVQGEGLAANRIQVWGIDSGFYDLAVASSAASSAASSVGGTAGGGAAAGRRGPAAREAFPHPGPGQVVISRNLASRLQVSEGDFLLLRLTRIGPMPPNTPFVSDRDVSLARRVEVAGIAGPEDGGHFNLNASQSAPLNLFADLNWLNRIMGLEDMANLVVINTAAASDPLSPANRAATPPGGDRSPDTPLMDLVRGALAPEDLGLNIAYIPGRQTPATTGYQPGGYWHIASDKVFIDPYISAVLQQEFPEAEFSLTYFVNSLETGDNQTPYSFVSAGAGPRHPTSKDEIFISRWLANDLQARPGDSLLMRYFEVGPLRELIEKEAAFIISGIVPMDQAVADSLLMPQLPGLSDAGSCNEWEAGVPILLDLIRPEDEAYWDQYRGTPKAWISLERGQAMWENRFGNLTRVLIPATGPLAGDESSAQRMQLPAHDPITDVAAFSEQDLRTLLRQRIDPFQMAFLINPVKDQGMAAAAAGVDFGQLFAGLGFFTILGGLILAGLLFSLGMKKRSVQLQLLAALGYSRKLIQKIMMAEALAISLAGAAAGLLLSLIYSRLVFSGLNSIWHDIVRADALALYFRPLSLIAGFLLGVVSGMLPSLWIIGRYFSRPVPGSMVSRNAISTGNFSRGFGLHNLAWKNLLRNRTRSLAILLLLALGSFVIVLTAANRKDLGITSAGTESGTGGFHLMIEASVPVLDNLNLPETRNRIGLPDNLDFVQFLTTHQDDASCLNLNQVEQPRILATDIGHLKGRFRFVARHGTGNQDPWDVLDQDFGDAIPAVADQTVLRWGLGLSVGDTLYYGGKDGRQVKLLLIGGLANSIFQGNVIISRDHFLRNFPSGGGSDVILAQITSPEDPTTELLEETSRELAFLFSDQGWEIIPAVEKLREFNSIENTYLAIFFLMGAFGMLLGTLGLAIVIAQSIHERRKETAMLRALGYGYSKIVRLFVLEYTWLFFAGIMLGILPALAINIKAFAEGSQNISLWFLLAVLFGLMLNGLLWIFTVSASAIRKTHWLADLRNE